MKRAPWIWMKTVAVVLVTLGVLTGVAWADPSGAADVPQVLNVATFKGTTPALDQQTRTFLTSDPILAGCTLYDPNAACAGVAPALLQLLAFNLEGQLLFNCFPGTPNCTITSLAIAPGSKYRLISTTLNAGFLAAGSYNLIFLIKDCTNVNFFVSSANAIRVLP